MWLGRGAAGPEHGGREGLIDAVFEEERSRLLAGLLRLTRDFDLAEDCLSEALEAALRHWPSEGVPARPGAWLATVARRRALDRMRHGRVADRYVEERELAGADGSDYRSEPPPQPGHDETDHRLSLIFTCCHPALNADAQVALTLRTLGGLTTEEIARAFLVGETTMAQRLVRAQRKIKDAGIPFDIPPPERFGERLEGVLTVLYLIFNEGYYASSGPGVARHDLCRQALALAELTAGLLPREAEPAGLYALMLLQHSRLPARLGSDGEAVTLEEQDRTLWDRASIDRAVRVIDAAMRMGRPGPYQIQAAIACVHCRAASAEATDWPGIVSLYGALLQLAPSPIVELNLAAAVAMADGPSAGLARLEDLPLGDYAPFHAVRADLWRRLGRSDQAREAYERALALERNAAARRTLQRRLVSLPA